MRAVWPVSSPAQRESVMRCPGHFTRYRHLPPPISPPSETVSWGTRNSRRVASPSLGVVRCTTYEEKTLGRWQTLCSGGTRATSHWNRTLEHWKTTVQPVPGARWPELSPCRAGGAIAPPFAIASWIRANGALEASRRSRLKCVSGRQWETLLQNPELIIATVKRSQQRVVS
jgi:hypothetical protein